MDDHTDGDWSEYQRLVLAELQRHNDSLLMLNAQMTDIKIDLASIPITMNRVLELEGKVTNNGLEIAALKVQAGIWGACGGLLGAVAVVLLHFFKG